MNWKGLWGKPNGHIILVQHTVPPRPESTIDILREFLESSTIHGVTDISTAKVGTLQPDSSGKNALEQQKRQGEECYVI